MKKTILATMLLIMTGIVFGQNQQKKDAVKNNKDGEKCEITSEKRSVTAFSGIEASQCFDISVVKGSKEEVVITTDAETMIRVKTYVENGILKLKLKSEDKHWWKKFNQNNNVTIKAEITVVNLNSVDLSGACKLASEETFDANSFHIDLSGASVAKLKVNVTSLNVEISGASKLGLYAAALSAAFEASGATKMNLNLTIADKLSISTSGASSVTAKGSAKRLNLDLSGATNAKLADLLCQTANIDCSGASKTEVNVANYLTLDASGASSVRYKGQPKMKIDTSGASSIKSID